MAREPKDGDMEAAGEGEEFGPWYDSQTGQQFDRLPMQPISFQKYARKGWIPGIAPIELKAKWEAAQAERDAVNKALVARFSRSKEGKELEEEAKNAQPAAASTEDVANAVIEKLVKLGIIKVPVETEIDQETEAAADLTEAGKQLKLL